jgi:cysteine desulfurase
MFPKSNKKTIYLDYASTTPVDPKVIKAMVPFLGKSFGNPSNLYNKGREAKLAVDESRKKIAEIIGARPNEIVFTAGGTESCNLAIFGVARRLTPIKQFDLKAPHIIVSTIEHQAVLAPVIKLIGEGFRVTFLPVNEQGFVDVKKLAQEIRPETILVSIMYANNEVGTIEPIAEIGKLIKLQNSERRAEKRREIIFHTDACQAAGSLDLNVNKLGVDLMSINGSKIYGSKQTGFLFVRSGTNLEPIIYGGGQEKGLRSGTENVAGVVGLGLALAIADKEKKSNNQKIGKLQKYLIEQLLKIPGIELNGPKADGVRRLVNNINIYIKDVEGEALMLYLDSYGVLVSTGSACSSTNGEASHVLQAMGKFLNEAESSIRLSLGKATSKADLDYTLAILKDLVVELRKVKGMK